jgi:hypothetical protein
MALESSSFLFLSRNISVEKWAFALEARRTLVVEKHPSFFRVSGLFEV